MAFHHHKQIANLDCTATEKAVLNALALFADVKGVCWPSQHTIAEASGVSDRTVRRALRALENKGYVRITHTQTSNVYTMTVSGGQVVQSGWTECPVQVDTVSYKHTKEQIREKIIESGVAIANAGDQHMKPSKYQQGMTADEAMKLIQGKGQVPAKTGKVSASMLESLFKELLIKHFDSCNFVASFTVKERGQMAQFIKKVGPENAVGCLRWAIENWWWWVGKCDIKVKPAKPSPGFILQHCNVAMSGWIEDKEKEKHIAEKAAKKPVAVPEVIKKPEPEYVSNIATLEDLEAILAASKAGKGGAP